MIKLLMLLYIWEGVAAKTFLYWKPGVYKLHMFASILLPAALVVFHMNNTNASRELASLQRDKTWGRVWGYVLFIAGWGGIGAVLSPPVVLNVVYSVTFGLMFAVCWLVAPSLVRKVGWHKSLDWAFAPLYGCVVVSFLMCMASGFSLTRVHGVFYTSAQAAWSASLCALAAYYRTMTSRGMKRNIFLGCLACSAGLTILTRTRGHILAMMAGLVVMWALCATTPQERTTRRGQAIAAFVVVGFLAMFYGESKQAGKTMEYLRIREGETTGVLDTRTTCWKLGWDSICESPVVGQGWLSKWAGQSGGESAAQTGRSYSFTDDPHNLYLTVGKSVGFPGLVAILTIMVALNLKAFRMFQTCRHFGATPEQGLFMALVGWTLAASLISNPLISFGATTDRYTWAMLGTYLAMCAWHQSRKPQGIPPTMLNKLAMLKMKARQQRPPHKPQPEPTATTQAETEP